MQSLVNNTLYFVPIIGTIHHLHELYKLNKEFEELAKFAPSIRKLSGFNTVNAQLNNEKCYKELDSLSPQLKIRFSKYFEKENQVAKLAFFGSIVQQIIGLAAMVFHPAFLFVARVDCCHCLYSVWKLVAGSDRHYYDPAKNSSVVYRRDFMGEQAIFGKKVVDIHAMSDTLKILSQLKA